MGSFVKKPWCLRITKTWIWALPVWWSLWCHQYVWHVCKPNVWHHKTIFFLLFIATKSKPEWLVLEELKLKRKKYFCCMNTERKTLWNLWKKVLISAYFVWFQANLHICLGSTFTYMYMPVAFSFSTHPKNWTLRTHRTESECCSHYCTWKQWKQKMWKCFREGDWPVF